MELGAKVKLLWWETEINNKQQTHNGQQDRMSKALAIWLSMETNPISAAM